MLKKELEAEVERLKDLIGDKNSEIRNIESVSDARLEKLKGLQYLEEQVGKANNSIDTMLSVMCPDMSEWNNICQQLFNENRRDETPPRPESQLMDCLEHISRILTYRETSLDMYR